MSAHYYGLGMIKKGTARLNTNLFCKASSSPRFAVTSCCMDSATRTAEKTKEYQSVLLHAQKVN